MTGILIYSYGISMWGYKWRKFRHFFISKILIYILRVVQINTNIVLSYNEIASNPRGEGLKTKEEKQDDLI